MAHLSNLFVAAFLALAGPTAAMAGPAHSPEEEALLAVDMQQRDAVGSVDLKAIERISHPNLRVNAPNNRILTREDLISMVASGEVRNELFERIPETVVITGNVGVVMGREVVLPGSASEQARMYGRRTLKRRYTNIYLRENGVWRHLARHANIVPDPVPVAPAPPPPPPHR